MSECSFHPKKAPCSTLKVLKVMKTLYKICIISSRYCLDIMCTITNNIVLQNTMESLRVILHHMLFKYDIKVLPDNM